LIAGLFFMFFENSRLADVLKVCYFEGTQEPVHFVFRAHCSGEPFLPKPERFLSGVKSFVFEDSAGLVLDELPVSENSFFYGETVFDRTWHDFVVAALKNGVKFYPGELCLCDSEKQKLDFLNRGFDEAQERARVYPCLDNIEKMFGSMAEWIVFRHELIIRTIKTLVERDEVPIVVRYGAGHHFLFNELLENGVKVSQEIGPLVFSWENVVVKRIIDGKFKLLSAVDFNKAFISTKICPRLITELIFGEDYLMTDRTVRFADLVTNTLLNRLSEERFDELVCKCFVCEEIDMPVLIGKKGKITGDYSTGKKMIDKLFSFNGLPEPSKQRISENQLVQFLEKNHQFWAISE